MTWACPKCGTTHYEAGLHALTPMERRVLQEMVNGRESRKLAADLGVSPNTIRTHRTHIYDKLDVHSQVEAVAYAIRHGMRPQPEAQVGAAGVVADGESSAGRGVPAAPAGTPTATPASPIPGRQAS